MKSVEKRPGGSAQGMGATESKKMKETGEDGHVEMASLDKCYPIDDLMLGGVKAHLSAIDRMFFDALSQQFASFKIKGQRLSLVFEDADVFSHGHNMQQQQHTKHYLITVRDKKGRDVAQYRTPKGAGPSPKMKALFSRLFLQRFDSVTIGAIDKPNAMVKKLLQATIEATGELESSRYPLDVRRFQVVHYGIEMEDEKCWPMWIERIAPFVRHVQIKDCGFGSFGVITELKNILPSVIGHCQQLRTVDLLGQGALDYSTPDPPVATEVSARAVAASLCSLPHLRSLRILDRVSADMLLTRSLSPPPPLPKRQLTLSEEWVDAMATVDRAQLATMLKKMNKFDFHERTPVPADLTFFLSSMRPLDSTAVREITVHKAPFILPVSMLAAPVHHWLAVAKEHRALLKLIVVKSLPSHQEFAEIHDQANIGGLLPLTEDDIKKMVFKFVNGAQVKLLRRLTFKEKSGAPFAPLS